MKRSISVSADESRKQDLTQVGAPGQARYGHGQAALLEAICKRPDDDGPRLGYMETLEKDDPRREFIAAQLKVASFLHGAREQECISAYSVATRLIMRHYAEWRPHWRQPVLKEVNEYAFWRGFVELVKISGKAFLEVGHELSPAAPILHLDLVSTAGLWDELSHSRELKSIRSITLNYNGLTDQDIFALAQSPYLRDLRWLSLTNNKNISKEGVEALARRSRTNLSSLRYISLQGTGYNPIEQYTSDGDYITSTWLPDEGVKLEQKFGTLPWLHRNTTRRSLIPPRRFTVLAINEKQFS